MFDPSTIDISKVTFGTYNCVGLDFTDRRMVNLSEIEILPINKNSSRSSGEDQAHINSLELSFRNGIRYDDPPPVIIPVTPYYDSNDNYIQWRLIAGNHRFKAMRGLGFESWVFDIYNYDENSKIKLEHAILSFQLNENNHPPVKSLTQNDAEKSIIMLIADDCSLVNADETSIKSYLNEICSYMDPGSKSKVIKNVIRHFQENGKIAFDITRWSTKLGISDYLKGVGRTSQGEYDKTRDQHGFCADELSFSNVIFRCLDSYAKTDKIAYFTSYIRDPKTKEQLFKKREIAKETEKQIYEVLLKAYRYYEDHGSFPVYFAGFLPQDLLGNETKLIR